MRRLAAAVMFLTRLPMPREWNFGAADVSRSMIFFSLLGAGIGAIQCGFLAGVFQVFRWVSLRSGHAYSIPAPVLAVTTVSLGVLITGALHLDGLADMADGFGGGRTKDDVLRIMRDHNIGAYGAAALVLVLALKITSISVLIERGMLFRFLLIAPTLARGSIVVLGFILPYARDPDAGLGGVAQQVSAFSVFVNVSLATALSFWLGGWRGGAALAVVVIVTLWNALRCARKIQGVTGDTLGANVELCEALVLAAGAVLAG